MELHWKGYGNLVKANFGVLLTKNYEAKGLSLNRDWAPNVGLPLRAVERGMLVPIKFFSIHFDNKNFRTKILVPH